MPINMVGPSTDDVLDPTALRTELDKGFDYLSGHVVTADIVDGEIDTVHWPRLEHYGFPLHGSIGQSHAVFGHSTSNDAPRVQDRRHGRYDILTSLLDDDELCVLPFSARAAFIHRTTETLLYRCTFSASCVGYYANAGQYMGNFSVRWRERGSSAAWSVNGFSVRIGTAWNANQNSLFSFTAMITGVGATWYDVAVFYDADGSDFNTPNVPNHIVIGYTNVSLLRFRN